MAATFDGERARVLRQMASLSRYQLAAKIGKSESFVHRMEHDKGRPALGTLCALADVLGCSVADLFAGDRPSVGTALFEVVT